VQYEATALSGREIKGTQALQRDGLLNEPLPPPGTPVLVLVLDESFYFLLQRITHCRTIVKKTKGGFHNGL
jgi:hypothetical protein